MKEHKKKNDAPVQKYAGYLYNKHLSKSKEIKDEWDCTTKGLYLRTMFGYTSKKERDMRSEFGYTQLYEIAA